MIVDEVFGQKAMSKINIGDIVCWSELSDVNTTIISPIMKKRFGFVSRLEIVFRGDRKVGIVKVIPMGSTTEKDILAVCVSLVNHQNNQEA
jgi:hypothetical protein